jgi:hypothetical protein
MKLEISRQIFKKYSNIKEIRQVGAELFLAEDRHRQTKLTVAFRNFANAPDNGTCEGVFLTFTHLRTKINTTPQHTALPGGITYTPLYLFVV